MTEIFGTIGPSCADAGILASMLESGMTGIRLNLSHSTLKESEKAIKALRMAEKKAGKKCMLLVDLQGPELRTGKIEAPVNLNEGDRIILGTGGIPVPDAVLREIRNGSRILIDDGKILLEAESTDGSSVTAAAVRGGLLQSRKSIAIPGVSIQSPALTADDYRNISEAAGYGVDAVMQPFVRCPEDLIEVRRALDEAGCEDIRIFAKIENMQGADNLESLLPYADEIVIARGDLGNSMLLWELPAVQKRIASACRKTGKAFMVVTQMLSSMEKNAVPTRAEVSDIFNAVLDGASSVMVTGETAVGSYPREVIEYLSNTAKEAEKYLSQTSKN